MCYYYSHNVPKVNAPSTHGVIWYVQSYLVLHLHARKRLATNKQKTRAQRRSSHGNNHCPDLLKIKTIKLCGKIRKTSICSFHKFMELLIRGNCRYLNSFVLSV